MAGLIDNGRPIQGGISGDSALEQGLWFIRKKHADYLGCEIS